MPDRYGNFKGQGWSRKKELAWERIFTPKAKPVRDWRKPLMDEEATGVMRMVAQWKP